MTTIQKDTTREIFKIIDPYDQRDTERCNTGKSHLPH